MCWFCQLQERHMQLRKHNETGKPWYVQLPQVLPGPSGDKLVSGGAHDTC